MKKISLLVIVELATIFICKAQIPSLFPWNGVVPAIMNSAGGSYDNALSYYRYEWSTGELTLIQALAPADSSILVTHGVLQPCTEKVGTSPVVLIFEAGDYKIFPNPTTGPFELDFFINVTGQMSLQLINSAGQLLEKRSYFYDGCCRIELFDLSRYPNGVYFLIADLETAMNHSDGSQIRKHGGFKVVKLD